MGAGLWVDGAGIADATVDAPVDAAIDESCGLRNFFPKQAIKADGNDGEGAQL